MANRQDALRPVKEGPLGESNNRLTARHNWETERHLEVWSRAKVAIRMMEAEAEAFEERTGRKGICPDCFMERSCGVTRGKHICW